MNHLFHTGGKQRIDDGFLHSFRSGLARMPKRTADESAVMSRRLVQRGIYAIERILQTSDD